MKLPGQVTGVSGGIIMPVAIAQPFLSRRDIEKVYPHLERRFLDPQVYLTELDGRTCGDACANLASFGWFGVAPIAFDSTKQKQNDWKAKARKQIGKRWTGRVPTAANDIEDSIRVTLEFQAKLGCEGLILPAPLTTDIDTDYAAELQWLDLGLSLAPQIDPDRPRFATIAISDTCLRRLSPWSNSLLNEIVDQVSARQPEGVYIIVEQANEQGYYCTHKNTVGSLLRLVHGLKRGGIRYVLVGFAGTVGLLCVAVGADGWSTAWGLSERRLRLDAFERTGRAFPAFYSHAFAGEFHMQNDLDEVVAGGFLDRIADVTPASAGLVKALETGKKASSVPEWRFRVNNTTASKEHFLHVMVRETANLARLSVPDRIRAAETWLDSAAALVDDLSTIGRFNDRTSISHQHNWRAALTDHVANAR